MLHRPTRGQFAATAAGSTLALAIIPRGLRAAQFDYKYATPSPRSFSLYVRLLEAFTAITKETNGAFKVTPFPDGTMGSEVANISQIRSNTIQITSSPSIALSAVVPNIGVDGLGFAFKDEHAFDIAFDGPMGEYLRQQIIAKGIYAFPPVMNVGFRQVTSSNHPVHDAGDFNGFKIRAQPGQIGVDLFRSLGASPTPIAFTEIYLSLQTHLVDGQETPYQVIDTFKFYEVQKYLSVTNHQPTPFYTIMNMDAWNALPHDIQAVMTKHVREAVINQRRDTVTQGAAFADKLRRYGMIFNTADTDSMRVKLKPFYARWKETFGEPLWDLIERTTGKLT